jgi:hypothetical protein
MNIYTWFKEIPRNIKIITFCGIFLLSGLLSFLFFEDTKLIEKRIFSRQRDLSLALQLRDSYELKKRVLEKSSAKSTDQSPLSLSTIEDMIAKAFIGGRLIQLQPVTSKENKIDRRMAIDIRISGAPLNEVISFVKAAENSGFRISKIRLSLPSNNPIALDMQVTITERRARG